MHPFWTPDLAEDRRARLRKEADDARLAAIAANRRRAERSRLRVRVLDPADIDSIAGLFERLSWRSRYFRFMSPRPVPPRMVRYFANIDHQRHEAVGAFDGERLVGSAHYFQSEDATQAEIAAEIIDGYQRKGIGSWLLRDLADLARRRGITHFRATVLAENTSALALLRDMGWPAMTSRDGPELAVTTTIADIGSH